MRFLWPFKYVRTYTHDDVNKWDIIRVTGHLCGEFTGEFPAQRPVTRSLDVFSDHLRLKNGWVNNREAGDLRRHRTHYDVTAMYRTTHVFLRI